MVGDKGKLIGERIRVTDEKPGVMERRCDERDQAHGRVLVETEKEEEREKKRRRKKTEKRE